jgi:hypothetical protein
MLLKIAALAMSGFMAATLVLDFGGGRGFEEPQADREAPLVIAALAEEGSAEARSR